MPGKSNSKIKSRSDSNSNSSNGEEKRTVGEELFLVHMSRVKASEPDPNDFDREPTMAATGTTTEKTTPAVMATAESKTTPGEELWKVHCKRLQASGIEDEEDDDNEEAVTDGKPEGIVKAQGSMKGRKRRAGGNVYVASRLDGAGGRRVLHLRTRDVAIH